MYYFRMSLLWSEGYRTSERDKNRNRQIHLYIVIRHKTTISYLKFTILLIVIFKFKFLRPFHGQINYLGIRDSIVCHLTHKRYALAKFTYHLPLAWYYVVSFYTVKSAATQYSMVTHGTTYTHQIMFCLRSNTIQQQQVHYCWQCMSTPTHIISS